MQRAKILVSLLTLLLSSQACLSAQEELPALAAAPAPAPPRRPLADPQRANFRAERRERLLNLGGQVLNTFVPPDGGGPGGGPAPLDIGKLNNALGPLATMLLGGGRDIESLHVGFDPKGTNFAEDRFRLGADASLRRTAWAEAPSRVNATLGVQVMPSENGAPMAALDGRLRLQTPVVALANYALVQYKSAKRKHRRSSARARGGACYTS